MPNIKIILEYDGTNYFGWQMQKNTGETIQQKLEDCLSKINKSKVKIHGAGRTDSGVHALGQVASFKLDVDVPEEKIPIALNSMLPEDIVCKKAEFVSDSFHARYDTKGKKYRYRLMNERIPSVFNRHFVYNIYKPLDFALIKKVLPQLKGKHDFASFQSSGSDIMETVRTITEIKLLKKGKEYWLEIAGDGFLYNMVRIITGSLIEIGLQKRKADLQSVIKSKNRRQAGFTAPACGLTLIKVYY